MITGTPEDKALRNLKALRPWMLPVLSCPRLDLAADDGLPGQEGTFCMCTFWYVECLASCGKLNQARFYFEKMLGYSNHLGLFSEELGPKGEGLGNFPQAFTHLSLINAAFEADHRLDLVGKE